MDSMTRMRKLNHGNLNTSFYLGWQESFLPNTRGMHREREARDCSVYHQSVDDCETFATPKSVTFHLYRHICLISGALSADV